MELSAYNHVLMRIDDRGPICVDLLKENEGGGFTGYWSEFTPFHLLDHEIVTFEEYQKVLEGYHVTNWREITRTEFDAAFEAFPDTLWQRSFEDGFAFQMSEMLTGDITGTYATCAGKYYTRTMARIHTHEQFYKQISQPITKLRYGGE